MRHMIVLCAVLLAGCATECQKQAPLPPRVIDTACDWIPAITASANDTPETKREVIAYEGARQQNCPIHRGAQKTVPRGTN